PGDGRRLHSFPTRRSSDLAGASVFVIVFMAASGGKPTATAAVLTVVTIALSWLFVQTIFTLHYAHEFYAPAEAGQGDRQGLMFPDRKSTRLNSSHVKISYA